MRNGAGNPVTELRRSPARSARSGAAGTFLHAPDGSWHVPATTVGRALVLFYPAG